MRAAAEAEIVIAGPMLVVAFMEASKTVAAHI